MLISIVISHFFYDFIVGSVKKAISTLGILHYRSRSKDAGVVSEDLRAPYNVSNDILNPFRVLSLFKRMSDEVYRDNLEPGLYWDTCLGFGNHCNELFIAFLYVIHFLFLSFNFFFLFLFSRYSSLRRTASYFFYLIDPRNSSLLMLQCLL